MPDQETENRFIRIETSLEAAHASLAATNAALIRTNDALDRMAEENALFHATVRGAIDALLKNAAKHDEAIANLERQWEAYLRRLPPQ